MKILLAEKINIFEKDYDAADGSAARDYIQVWDLARGLLPTIKRFKRGVSIYADLAQKELDFIATHTLAETSMDADDYSAAKD